MAYTPHSKHIAEWLHVAGVAVRILGKVCVGKVCARVPAVQDVLDEVGEVGGAVDGDVVPAIRRVRGERSRLFLYARRTLSRSPSFGSLAAESASATATASSAAHRSRGRHVDVVAARGGRGCPTAEGLGRYRARAGVCVCHRLAALLVQLVLAVRGVEPLGILEATRDGILLYPSDGGAKMLGWRPDRGAGGPGEGTRGQGVGARGSAGHAAEGEEDL
ncbi:hypothetical protein DFP72DRAFT_582698 [Ephemerocybe angulata]|uniref:Uncharacterized protein n=1 Tax=Ephemerocybe angulata TaxID=980116 RepID=A0A8H6HL24_9AGAR|nr:hypothetical protein DFP72DRAFT_582698 [Tulosesus angulatus]